MYKSLKALLVSFLLTGAAGGGGPEGKDLARFTGVWKPTGGAEVDTCGGASSTNPIDKNVTWSLGSTSDLIQSLSTNCVIHADVEGDTASAAGAQTCTGQSTDYYGNIVNNSYSFTAYTFVLSADGRTATESVSGSLLQTDSGTGTTGTCTFTESGASYQKQ